MSQVVASAAYHEGRRVADVPVEEAGAWAARDGHFVWVGLLEPDEALLRRVQRQFGWPSRLAPWQLAQCCA